MEYRINKHSFGQKFCFRVHAIRADARLRAYALLHKSTNGCGTSSDERKNRVATFLEYFTLPSKGALALVCVGLAACGGSGTSYHTIGGTVAGLRPNTTLVLQDNNEDILTVYSNGSFAFPGRLALNANYSVTIGQQPLRQSCRVTSGAGSAVGDVSNITISCSPKFTVFEFLKLRNYTDSTGSRTTQGVYISDSWFQSFGVSPINLIYGSNLVDCPSSAPSDQCVLNQKKIAGYAASADSTGAIPVSLDLEVWDSRRFNPDVPTGNGKSILQNLTLGIQTFKSANPNALVGFYGEVPQDTFGWNTNTSATFGALNQKYASIASLVNYYSPVLYNYAYDGTSTGDSNWQSALNFSVQQAHAYDSGSIKKDVFPYITPFWTDGSGRSQLLTYDQMMFRLNALKKSGATGCILWISSSAVDATGKPVVVDAINGWFKAVIDFITTNQ